MGLVVTFLMGSVENMTTFSIGLVVAVEITNYSSIGPTKLVDLIIEVSSRIYSI
jgi:hypothetical protein